VRQVLRIVLYGRIALAPALPSGALRWKARGRSCWFIGKWMCWVRAPDGSAVRQFHRMPTWHGAAPRGYSRGYIDTPSPDSTNVATGLTCDSVVRSEGLEPPTF